MKPKITVISIIIITVLTGILFAGGAQEGEAQSTAWPPGSAYFDKDREINYQATMLGSDVVGMTVSRSSNDSRIGKVTDLVYNLIDGFVPYIICTFDGVEGLDPTAEVPIPLYMVSEVTNNKRLQLLIANLDILKNATTLDQYEMYEGEDIGWSRKFYSYWQNVGTVNRSIMKKRIREMRNYRYQRTTGRYFAPTTVLQHSELINSTVETPEEAELGAIIDFTLNMETGRIHHLVLFPDYSYDFENRYYQIPVNAFTLDTVEKKVEFTLGSPTIMQAPGFTEEWPRIDTAEWFMQVEEYWSKTAFHIDLRRGMRVIQQQVLIADELFGMDVSNYRQASLGVVEDLMVERAGEDLTYAMVEFGDTLGFRGGQTLIPVGAMSISRVLDMVYLGVDKEEITSAPRLKEGMPPDTTGPGEWDSTIKTYWQNVFLQKEYDKTEQFIKTVSGVKAMERPQALPVTSLKEFDIRNTQGKDIGNVNNILVNLNTKKAVYVIAHINEKTIEEDVIPEMQEVVIPLSSLIWDSAEKSLITGVDTEELLKAPSYEQLPNTSISGWDDAIRSYWEEQIGQY